MLGVVVVGVVDWFCAFILLLTVMSKLLSIPRVGGAAGFFFI